VLKKKNYDFKLYLLNKSCLKFRILIISVSSVYKTLITIKCTEITHKVKRVKRKTYYGP